MGGIAALAQAAGHRVTGSDQHVYPPMSDQLRELGIAVWEGYDPAHLNPAPNCVVVGNVISRGNPLLEAVLDRGLPYLSGPEWLARHILAERWVLAVAGTHGKTTTASLLAHILDAAHLAPGFLIGGVPGNFGRSARLGQAPFFVVEADEYDTAFFDKRAKFVHYRPRTLILNNLEYDHADIYPDLAAIQRQFHHLIRTVPGNGALIVNGQDKALAETLAMGCWTPVIPFGCTDGWHARLLSDDGSAFEVWEGASRRGRVEWSAFGAHNVANALAALLAARHAGVPLEIGCAALATFAGVRRRLEQRGVQAGVTVFDDFAHHPTAISRHRRRPARSHRRGAVGGGGGAAFQHHAPGHPSRGAGGRLGRGRSGVGGAAFPGRLGCGGESRAAGRQGPCGDGCRHLAGGAVAAVGGGGSGTGDEQWRLRWLS